MYKLYIDYAVVAELVGMSKNGVRQAMNSGRSTMNNMEKLAKCFKMKVNDLWFQEKTPATIVMETKLKLFNELNNNELIEKASPGKPE